MKTLTEIVGIVGAVATAPTPPGFMANPKAAAPAETEATGGA